MSDEPRPPAIDHAFPYLRARDAAAAIEYYGRAFGARETFRLSEPSGKVAHAELDFGGHTILISDEYPDFGIQGPDGEHGPGLGIHLHVDDVDALHARALEAGGEELLAPSDQFWGERISKLRDPFGHEWLLGHEIEKVSQEEMQRRFAELCKG